MITHGHPIAFEVLRLTVLVALAGLAITIGLPYLLALATTAAR